MQDEKQNIYEPEGMNRNPPVDKTRVLIDINDNLSFIKGIVVLMFLLQIGVIIFVYMFGIPVLPVWY